MRPPAGTRRAPSKRPLVDTRRHEQLESPTEYCSGNVPDAVVVGQLEAERPHHRHAARPRTASACTARYGWSRSRSTAKRRYTVSTLARRAVRRRSTGCGRVGGAGGRSVGELAVVLHDRAQRRHAPPRARTAHRRQLSGEPGEVPPPERHAADAGAQPGGDRGRNAGQVESSSPAQWHGARPAPVNPARLNDGPHRRRAATSTPRRRRGGSGCSTRHRGCRRRTPARRPTRARRRRS